MDLLKSIEIFREVCKQQSFSLAANQLNLVPSAVSRQVSELEKYLDVKLLQRTTRSVNLTSEGRCYLEKMEAISHSIRELKGQNQSEEGHIRITAAPIFRVQLAAALNEYLLEYPNVSISTRLVNREINLIEEGFDLALRVGELKNSNMISRRIGEFSVSVVASPEYVKKHGIPDHPRELSGHDCIINTLTKSPRRWMFRENGRKFSVKVRGRCIANDDALLQSYACSGLGIGFLPTCITSEAVHRENLIPILNEFVPEPLPISIVYPSREFLSPAKRKLIDHLINSWEQGHH